jgi:hypothetical protein
MSDMERCIGIIEKFRPDDLSYIAALLENAYNLSEAADDAYCVSLSERHKRSNREFSESDFSPIEEVLERLGVSPE